jgi:hypothetical protein
MAGGNYYSASNYERASIWMLSGGKWAAIASPVPADAGSKAIPGDVRNAPYSDINGISCPPSAKLRCIAVGDYVDKHFEHQGFFVEVANSGGSRGFVPIVTATTSEQPTTTTTSPSTTTTSPTTTTTEAPPASQITLASLDAAVAAQSDAAVAAGTGISAAEVATCGPPSVSFAVGTDIFCNLFDPSIGGAFEVIQITGSTPSSFTVVAGPGSDIPCAGLNAAEQAAFTADGESCDPN